MLLCNLSHTLLTYIRVFLPQAYVICNLQDKLNLLYSFIRTHVHAKVIVFVSSCKQSRFVFEAFRRLRPGVPLQLLHGKMKQQRRMLVYYDFIKKPAAVLFAVSTYPGLSIVQGAE
jgi:ATP-dependent RNA helicase DDX10/DBP4